MAVTLNASTSSGFIATSDTSGTLELQANGTTKATVGSTGLSIGQYSPSASLITSGTAVNSTSGTSIDFTSIPSWVKQISVMFSGVSTNGTSNIIVQLGDSGGIETTGYLSGASNYNGYTSFTTGLAVTFSNQAIAVWGGLLVIQLINASTNSWVSSSNLNDSSSGAQIISAAGSKSLSATLDRIRITTVNGTDTFDAGTINILYE